MPTQNYARRLRVLVLVPHQDDESLGPGATLAKLADLGAQVHIRAATGGQRGAGGSTPEETMAVRLAEFANACRTLGAASSECWGFMDNDLLDSLELRDKIVAEGKAVGANLMIVTAWDDYHTDHRALGLASLNSQHRWLGSSPALVFMDHFVRGMGAFAPVRPDIWLDASAYWAVKRAAYACHASQGSHLEKYMEDLGKLRGEQRKPQTEYAECFRGSGTAGHDAGLRDLILACEG
jgi:LmbE family N-acetylglucosaminyl deacetylase